MSELIRLQEDFRTRVNSARGILPILEGDKFKELYEASTKKEKEQLSKILEKLDRDGLKDWMENHSTMGVEDWSASRLKERAYQLGVKNYSRLLRHELIVEVKRAMRIQDEKRRNASRNQNVGRQDDARSEKTGS